MARILFATLERAEAAKQALLGGAWIVTLADINVSRYYRRVIASFRDADTERVFLRERAKKLPAGVQRRAHRKLLLLNAARSLADLKVPPGNRLEKLSGDRSGQHSIRVNQQWRICFRWDRGDARDVELTDYH